MTFLTITFGEHVPQNRVRNMVSGIAAYGNVFPDGEPRTFRAEVFRPSKLPELKAQLLDWERYGFLRWTEAS
jgi:hypothetical protein